MSDKENKITICAGDVDAAMEVDDEELVNLDREQPNGVLGHGKHNEPTEVVTEDSDDEGEEENGSEDDGGESDEGDNDEGGGEKDTAEDFQLDDADESNEPTEVVTEDSDDEGKEENSSEDDGGESDEGDNDEGGGEKDNAEDFQLDDADESNEPTEVVTEDSDDEGEEENGSEDDGGESDEGDNGEKDGTVPVNKVATGKSLAVPATEKARGKRSESIIKSDNLSVTLTFETSRQKITLGELETIKSGYTFVCTNPTQTPVEIRANGTLIGYGRLVDVEGKFGVQVMEFIEKC
ncbi:MAG: FliM/FliN family flagellar motor switch protein [Puniceicoccales bacterium]|jgi:flagellar motor switch/type III secretory pathway protein FliN|nr:FliM/FliN family flagellar motor switch protein [Puniceicoccales bacterium]